MALEIISKLKRERVIMVAVIILLFFSLVFTNVYYNHKIYRLMESYDGYCELMGENKADIPAHPIIQNRKEKKKW